MILNAVMCVWNEEDIIESTVKNLFAQGCSNVFVIDNDSTDKTVDISIQSGAILADSFESKYFNEFEKIAHLNTVVKNYNNQSDEEHIWWLYADADEFPNIDGSIFNYLNMLHKDIRAVHGFLFDHIPTHPPYHVSGYHPADFQPLCVKTNTTKIPLLRYDKNKPHLYSAGGAHTFDTCGGSILVAKDVLDIHHFQYRRPESTISRLKKLTAKNPDGISRIDWLNKREQIQSNSLNAKSAYHHRCNYAKSVYSKNKNSLMMIDELPYSYKNIVRWYDENNFEYNDNTLINKCMYNYYLDNYNIAICKFYELLDVCSDKNLQVLVTIKIAQCLSFVDKNESLYLLKSIIKYENTEISDYAKKCYEIIYENKLQKLRKDNDRIFFDVIDYSCCFEHKLFV